MTGSSSAAGGYGEAVGRMGRESLMFSQTKLFCGLKERADRRYWEQKVNGGR